MAERKSSQQSSRPMGGHGPGPGGRGNVVLEKPKNSKETLKRLFGYFSKYKWQLVIVFLFVFLFSLSGVVGPYLMGVAIDKYIQKGVMDGFIGVVLGMAGAYLFGFVTNVISGLLMAKISQNTLYDIRNELFGHLQTLSLKFFDSHTHGELMSRLTNDINAINQAISQNVTQLFSSIISLVAIVVMMFVLSPILALLSFVAIPLVMGVVVLISKQTREGFIGFQKGLGSLNGIMEESISGQHVVISFRKQDDFLKEFDVKNEEVYDAAMKAQVYSQLMMPITGLTNTINIALMAGAGGALALNGMVSVGVVATMLTYTQRFMQPIRQLATMFNSLQGAIVGAERVFEILDQVSEIQNNEKSHPFETIKGQVVFDGVDFSYVEDTPVLKNVSFDAEPGEMVALVGPTGAGKTTIVNILSRFYDIQAGSVKIDDVDVRDYNKEELRRGIGMVLQDGFLFAGTVMDNIRYGRLDATDKECVEAAKMANAHSFIHRLPKGYNSILTERGENISQGQRQLLTIARAILANPQILILDEATSSVDTRTEVLIQTGLHALMEGRTSFVIAHRLSTIRDADKVLVIDNGEIVEQGTHDSLLEKHGFYYKMYMQQFRGKTAI